MKTEARTRLGRIIASLTVPDLRAGARVLPTGSRCLVMGVVNVTPDSFSDGGEWLDPAAAVAHGLRLAAEGADILDIGGESTRPGAAEIDPAEERSRVMPVIRALMEHCDVPLSIDTRHAEIARAALDAGAVIVNDISAARHDPDMLPLVAEFGAALILMHMQGTPATMQDDPHYDDVVATVETFLRERVDAALVAGIARDALAVDPGIGFGKRYEDNIALLEATARLAAIGPPLLVGASRKRFIGRALGDLPVTERTEGSLAAAVWAVERGARIVRVHDVEATVRAVRMTEALMGNPPPA